MRQWFKNLSLRYKILIPVALLGIMIILVAVTGIVGQRNIANESELISQKHIPGIENLSEISKTYQSLRRVSFAHVVANESNNKEVVGNLEKERAEYVDKINSTCDTLEAYLVSSKDKESLNSFRNDFKAYVVIVDKILAASNSKNYNEAARLCNEDLRDAGKNLTSFVDDMMQSKQTEIKTAEDAQVKAKKSSTIRIGVTLALAVIVFAFTVWVSWKWAIKRLINIKKQLAGIIQEIDDGHGNLTHRVQCFCTDEIGALASAINTFLCTMHNIMVQIGSSSTELETIVNNVSTRVDAADHSSVGISSTMEEMSASMQEVTAMVMNINESVSNTDEHINDLAKESKNLNEYASTMQERAQELEKNAVTNRDNTSSVIEEIVKNLNQAIEESRSVEQVNNLTDEIVNISSQTNLLSLNASIEAARAGEAGRGFAVVAGEIGSLAESSKEVANNIQTINATVIKSVEALKDSANELVNYVNANVLPDYENFVNISHQYNDDALHVNETVDKFDAMSNNLQNLMSSISEAVGRITGAVTESSNGVQDAAQNTQHLVNGIAEISTAMSDNKRIANTLGDEANGFINLDQSSDLEEARKFTKAI